MIEQLLSSNVYQALVNASSPSAVNPYVTTSTLAAGYVPYTGANANLDLSSSYTVSARNYTISGTAGNGYLQFTGQISTPTVANGMMYYDSTLTGVTTYINDTNIAVGSWTNGTATLGVYLDNSSIKTSIGSVSNHVLGFFTGFGSVKGGLHTNGKWFFGKPNFTSWVAPGALMELTPQSSTSTNNVFAVRNSTDTSNIFTIGDTGFVNIGNYASPTAQRLVTIGQDSAYMTFGSLVGSTNYCALYFNQSAPSVTNYGIIGTTNETYLNTEDVSFGASVGVRINNSSRFLIRGNSTTGAVTTFTLTNSTHTGQTASTEISNFKVNGASKTWAAGAITTQRWNYFTANTAAFASASTITNSYGLFVEAATAGTNATITNNYALGTNGALHVSGTTYNHTFRNATDSSGQSAYFLGVAAGSESSTNYALKWSGNLEINAQNATGQVILESGGASRLTINGASTSGSNDGYLFNATNMTGVTVDTAVSTLRIPSRTRTWGTTANITNQRDIYFASTTYAAGSASGISNAYGLYVEAPTAGSNVTITNNYAAGFGGALQIQTGSITNKGIVLTNLTSDATQGALYMNVTPSSTNYFLTTDGATMIVNGVNNVITNVSATERFRVEGSYSSQAKNGFTFSAASNTGQTASTEINGYLYNSYSRQWAAGAINTQRERYYKTVTYAFASASTITDAYGAYFEAPTAGTNATITNNYAAGFNGNVILNTSSARLWLGDMAVSSTNYALGYTNTNEVSLNSGAIGRIRSAGTIIATWTSTDFTISGSSGLVIANNSNDGKILMTRTSGNNHSLQLSAAGYFMYNNTAAAVRYGVTNAGNFYVGDTSSLATTATDGFLYLPSCAGVPTGVPTAITGKVPIVVDSTNNKAYIYSGGAWVALN